MFVYFSVEGPYLILDPKYMKAADGFVHLHVPSPQPSFQHVLGASYSIVVWRQAV